MTLGKMLTNMGINLPGTKHVADRYTEYTHPAHAHGHQVHYAYEEPTHVYHVSSPKHHGGGNKNNAAMSALTLLAFLFFLHILQECLKEHMDSMTNQQPIMVVTSGRNEEIPISKTTNNNKLDKAGITEYDMKANEDAIKKNPFTKVNTEIHTPNIKENKFKHVYKNRNIHSDSEYDTDMDLK